MSIASARDLYAELLVNAELAREVDALDDERQRWELLRTQGYDFTRAEWDEVQREVETFIALEFCELDEQALDHVNGGGGGSGPCGWLSPAAQQQLQAGALRIEL